MPTGYGPVTEVLVPPCESPSPTGVLVRIFHRMGQVPAPETRSLADADGNGAEFSGIVLESDTATHDDGDHVSRIGIAQVEFDVERLRSLERTPHGDFLVDQLDRVTDEMTS